MINAGRMFPVLLCVCVLLLWSVQSCGKKGDPRPPDVTLPDAISDLRAAVVETGVYLRWGIPDAIGGIHNFKIQRHEQGEGRHSCIDCPREFVIVADISLDDPALKKEERSRFGYLDRQVKAGYYYAYQVIACDEWQHCTEPSNMEEIKAGAKVLQGREGVKNTSK